MYILPYNGIRDVLRSGRARTRAKVDPPRASVDGLYQAENSSILTRNNHVQLASPSVTIITEPMLCHRYADRDVHGSPQVCHFWLAPSTLTVSLSQSNSRTGDPRSARLRKRRRAKPDRRVEWSAAASVVPCGRRRAFRRGWWCLRREGTRGTSWIGARANSSGR